MRVFYLGKRNLWLVMLVQLIELDLHFCMFRVHWFILEVLCVATWRMEHLLVSICEALFQKGVLKVEYSYFDPKSQFLLLQVV